MESSQFNARVKLPNNEVFLTNTFTDAQLIVSPDVADLLESLDRPRARRTSEPSPVCQSSTRFTASERRVLSELAAHGFVVDSRRAERQALDRYFEDHRKDTEEMHVTILTTLQCNFACDYCLQGDHDDWNASVTRMDPGTAHRVCDWLASRLDTVGPKKLSVTFFGGEPLLNLEALYLIAERAWRATQERSIELSISIITNGLLLTPEVVDRLTPYGLEGIKVTLDGDRHTHDRMRPLRGGQGTFDRIVENIRQVADRCSIAVGGNFDEDTVDSYPALLDFLREQSFADSLVKVSFKPIISAASKTATAGIIPLTSVDETGRALAGGCMSAAGTGQGSPCQSCQFLDEKMSFLREETKKRGFPTPDGLHMGPCEITKTHAYTVGTNGELFACPGFAAEADQSVGHIDVSKHDEFHREQAASRFGQLEAWKECGDCNFIPVCAGGCSAAAHNELGDMNRPSCHKDSFEAAVVTMAREATGGNDGSVPQSAHAGQGGNICA